MSALKPPIIRDVADTASWVASYRAMESARPDALFHDPDAEKLRFVAADLSEAVTRQKIVMSSSIPA